MKINHSPGSKVETTDTNKLPDIDALILEKSEELKQLCSDSRRQCLVIVDAKGAEDGSSYSFWNLQMQNGDPRNNEDDLKYAADNLLICVDKFVKSMTGGQVGLKSVYE